MWKNALFVKEINTDRNLDENIFRWELVSFYSRQYSVKRFWDGGKEYALKIMLN